MNKFFELMNLPMIRGDYRAICNLKYGKTLGYAVNIAASVETLEDSITRVFPNADQKTVRLLCAEVGKTEQDSAVLERLSISILGTDYVG